MQNQIRELVGIAFKCLLIGVVLATFTSLVYAGEIKPGPWGYSVLYNAILSFALWIGNGMISDYVPISWVERPALRFGVSLGLTVVYTLGVAVGVHILFRYLRFGQSPAEAMDRLQPSFLISVMMITFIISLFLHGRAFLIQWKASLLEAERLKQTQLSSRLEGLKNQINPHFLFNSLNVLSGLVYKDPDLSARFIRHLADVYRYVLDVQDQEATPLRVELEALEAYLFLLKIRFGDNLRIDIDLDTPERWATAPLTLQMLVENAVKHNVVSKAHPLHITLCYDPGGRYLVVKNNLERKNNPQESNGIGLRNIRERYSYLTNLPVQVQETTHTFEVSIPLLSIQPAA